MSDVEALRRRLASGEVTCEALIAFLGDYLAGELPAERASAVEAHLARCPSCVAYLATYRATIELARGAARAPETAAPAIPAELLAAILAARG